MESGIVLAKYGASIDNRIYYTLLTYVIDYTILVKMLTDKDFKEYQAVPALKGKSIKMELHNRAK